MPQPWQVLVVDDDPAWRLMVSVFLDPDERLSLLAATSLAGALQLDCAPPPDAILIDTCTNGADGPGGVATLFQVRARWPDATIFVYTAAGGDAELALAVGADAVISKLTPPRTTVRLLALATEQRAGHDG